MKLLTNGHMIARSFRRKAQSVMSGFHRGMRRLTSLAEKEQQDRLRGSNTAAPGDYPPVPNRTGTLFRGAGAEARGSAIVIFNTADHALPVHEGWERGDIRVAGRPFAADAARQVEEQGTAVMAKSLREVWQ
ncbi:hypothetical protein [Natronospira bacteriovora]|uniref:Uncharacterized protein n=1 Tax=Natronospira bacteriovora TaxID=3069753 RepID=A0ABU0W5M1_9GAMM|nr:hypothetical protein [Natronospira sp. AB-CW4]MDQ2069320.1 hypothetical protein [Natronospira sp. AB-CW4]